MKNKAFFFLVWTVMLARVLQSSGQTNVLFYGTNASSIGVSFIDTNLSVSAQASILTDLGTQCRLGADDPDFVANLYNSDSTLYNPKAIDVLDNLFQTG